MGNRLPILTPLPTLDELAAHPERVQGLPPAVARELLPRVVGLQTALLAKALTPETANGHLEASADGDLLTVGEAAQKLSVSKDWLYRRADTLPFTVRLGPAHLRFSERGIEKYIRQRQGK